MATTDKNAKAIHGEVVDFGAAPYKNDPTKNNSFYVTLNQNGDDKTFWGNGLKSAIEDAEIKKGDTATFVDRGVESVSVPDENGNFIPAKKRTWDAEKYEPPLELRNSIEVDNAPDLTADEDAEVTADAETSVNLSKGKAVNVNANKGKDTGLPQSLENNYIAIARNRFLKDAKVNFYDKTDPKTVAFEDRTTTLNTSKSDEKTIKAMVDLAQSKNWKAISIKGDPEFKKQMWLEAEVRGIETKGYKPTEADRAELLTIQEGRTKNTITNDYARSKEIEQKEKEAAAERDAKASALAAVAVAAEVGTKTPPAVAIDNRELGEKERQDLLSELNQNADIKEVRASLDLATKDMPNQAWLNDAANEKFDKTLIEMNEYSENTGKVFTKDEVAEFAKNDIKELGQNLSDAEQVAVVDRFDIEVGKNNIANDKTKDTELAQKYEALHKDLEDHRYSENQVNEHKYHNEPEPTIETYEKATPEVKEAVINNLADNITADTKKLLSENGVDKDKIERIAEMVETDIRDRATIDANSPKKSSPISDYTQATNAHIIRNLGDDKGVEIANKNSEKMLGNNYKADALTAEKNGRYGEIVSDTLRDRKIDDLTVAKAQAVIYDPNNTQKPQQNFERYQQQVGEQLYKSGYGKNAIEIMNEVSDKYNNIERDTPEFLDTKLGGTAREDNSLSVEKNIEDDKGFKEAKVVEDVAIGEAKRSSKIATDKVEDRAVSIEAVKKMVHEVYKDDPVKLESCLKTIDDKSPDIMSGKAEIPQPEIKQAPQTEFKVQQQQSNIDRGR